MTKLQKLTLGALSMVLLAALVLGGASWYLLDYSLKPGDRGRNEALAWHEMDSLYPGLVAWRDSLQAAGNWHDTIIVAPDGARLHAYYADAPRATRRTAVLVHGYTDCAVRMMHLGRMYQRDLRANILLPDLRNAGQSAGNHYQMGWLDRLDVKEWVNRLPTFFGDSLQAVVHGVSMGAATTMMLAGDTDVPPMVTAYVEDCGYTSVTDQFTKELGEQFGLPAWPLIPLASTLCKWRYGWSFDEASALQQVARCTRPMLFIHGSADKFVPTAMLQPLHAAHRGPKAAWLVPEAPHARSYQLYPAEYTRRVHRFVQRYAGW